MLIQDIFFEKPPAYANSKSIKMANRGTMNLLKQQHGELLRLHKPINPDTSGGPLMSDVQPKGDKPDQPYADYIET